MSNWDAIGAPYSLSYWVCCKLISVNLPWHGKMECVNCNSFSTLQCLGSRYATSQNADIIYIYIFFCPQRMYLNVEIGLYIYNLFFLWILLYIYHKMLWENSYFDIFTFFFNKIEMSHLCVKDCGKCACDKT